MSGHINVSGTWKELVRPYLKLSNSWYSGVELYVKVDGTWKSVYTRYIPANLLVVGGGSGAASMGDDTVYSYNADYGWPGPFSAGGAGAGAVVQITNFKILANQVGYASYLAQVGGGGAGGSSSWWSYSFGSYGGQSRFGLDGSYTTNSTSPAGIGLNSMWIQAYPGAPGTGGDGNGSAISYLQQGTGGSGSGGFRDAQNNSIIFSSSSGAETYYGAFTSIRNSDNATLEGSYVVQGNPGGTANANGPGGGGGGAGAVGSAGTATNGGAGGAGKTCAITGSTYGGGGGGSPSWPGYAGGAGGVGGGGAGGSNANGGDGAANSGGGGGASFSASPSGTHRGGNGGSGVIVIKYPSSYGTLMMNSLTNSTTTAGSDRIYTITGGYDYVRWDGAQ